MRRKHWPTPIKLKKTHFSSTPLSLSFNVLKSTTAYPIALKFGSLHLQTLTCRTMLVIFEFFTIQRYAHKLVLAWPKTSPSFQWEYLLFQQNRKLSTLCRSKHILHQRHNLSTRIALLWLKYARKQGPFLTCSHFEGLSIIQKEEGFQVLSFN